MKKKKERLIVKEERTMEEFSDGTSV